ncbi:MAG TPA: DinB family protein [Holophagaceae bacterium]|nr:DinB family protein [Holophagaceae bacterium]
MERSQLWQTAFKTNLWVLEHNLPGFTEALIRQRPVEGAACPGWLLGHLVGSRRLVLKLLGRPQPEDPSLACYGRGSTGAECGHSLAELVDRLKATTGLLEEALGAVEDWDRPALNPALQKEQPLEQVVAFLFMHDSYHLGQLGLSRKLLGLPGVI